MRRLSGASVSAHLPVGQAIHVLDEVLRSAVPLPDSEPRTRVAAEGGEMLIMSASGDAGAGVKVVTVAPGNRQAGLPLIHGAYLLFSRETLQLEALIDGPALTAVRTAAVSGWVTDIVARPDAHRLVVFGSGPQAHAHLSAMLAVRDISWVRVVSTNARGAADLAELARRRVADVDLGEPEAVLDADMVCCCTSSRTPLFRGDLLGPGTHVNAIGAHTPDTRELDTATVTLGRIIVETREAALEEAGDLLLAMTEGCFSPSDIVADLRELANGAPARRDPDDITIFKSVGVAFEDLILARALLDRASAAEGSDAT